MSSAYLSLLIFLPICQEQVNFYLWLCSAILGLLYLCRLWVSPAGSDGLWQVQGHQQPLILCSQYVGRVCSLLMAGVFPVGITVSQIHTALAFHLCFCGSNVINHFFFCDLHMFFFFFFPLSCSETQVIELVIFTALDFIELSTISGVLALIFISCFQSWRSTLLRGKSKLLPPAPSA